MAGGLIHDEKFVSRETAKITNFKEGGDTRRVIPIVSFIARRRDLRELVGEELSGAADASIQDTLNLVSGRFDMIGLEDRNLPQIAHARLLKPKDEAAAAKIAEAFERTKKLGPQVWDTLLGSDKGTTGADEASFRLSYPFSPRSSTPSCIFPPRCSVPARGGRSWVGCWPIIGTICVWAIWFRWAGLDQTSRDKPRRAAANTGSRSRAVGNDGHCAGSETVRWWAWAGYRANATLAATMTEVLDPTHRPSDFFLRVRSDITPQYWRDARAAVSSHSRMVLPAVSTTPSAAAQQYPADEGGLAGVLRVVIDDADQPHAEGHRWLPPGIDHARQVGVGEPGNVLDRPGVHGVVVAEQQIRRNGTEPGDIVRIVPVSGVRVVERQIEAPRPTLRGPHLLGAGDVGDMVVLYPGQVPHQPGDRIGLRVEARCELVLREPGDRAVHVLLDPAERIHQQVSSGHGVMQAHRGRCSPNHPPGFGRLEAPVHGLS